MRYQDNVGKNTSEPWDDDYAHAMLCRAAPDMLAALEQVLEFHAKCEREDVIDWQWFDAAYYAARAAIAKARGETKGE